MYKSFFARPLFMLILCMCLFCACSSPADKDTAAEPPVYSPPRVLVPEAPGTETLGSPPLILDVSNTEQGYLTACAESSGKRTNLQLLAPDSVLYSYFIEPGETAVIPFTGGSGTYQITCYQQVSGSQYAALYAQQIEVILENEFLPYIYPNQYVNFSPESKASQKALSMLPDDASDVEALDAVYTYVTGNITYDTEKAASVDAGYLPDVDDTLASGKGICFDYAALMTAMLRSRDIPCKLQIGYSGDIKHAWIDVYIRSKGWVEGAIAFDGETWQRMDPTFDANTSDKDFIRSFIGDGTNYTVQFTR